MTLVLAYQSLGTTRDITVQDSDGDTIKPLAGDAIRARIGREGEIDQLTVTEVATANGSVFTKDTVDGVNRLRLDAQDLVDIEPGTYTLYIEMQFSADADDWKNVDRQVFQLEGT